MCTKLILFNISAIVLLVVSAYGGSLLFEQVFKKDISSIDEVMETEQPMVPLKTRKSKDKVKLTMSNDAEEALSFERDLPARSQWCIEDPSRCPSYPSGQLEKDWNDRFQRTNRGGCYFDFRGVSPSCPELCDELFSEHSQNPAIGERVAHACRIGCGYAIKSLQSSSQTCSRDCKATVWDFDASDHVCMKNRGLGLTIPDFEVGKACEIGCILANERTCPTCDERARNAGSTKDV